MFCVYEQKARLAPFLPELSAYLRARMAEIGDVDSRAPEAAPPPPARRGRRRKGA